MRSRIEIGLGVVCLALAGGVAVLWREVDAQREAGIIAEAARDEATAQVRNLTARLDNLESRQSYTGFAPGNPANARSSPGAAPIDISGLAPSSNAAGDPGGSGAQLQGGPRGANRHLISTLKLQAQDAEKLRQLLEQRQAQSRQLARQNDGAPDRKRMNELQQETDRQVRALLGDSKYEEYQDYFRHVQEHMRVSQLERRLQDTGRTALSAHQQSQLFDILREEKALIPAPQRESFATPQQYRAAERDWQDNFEQRITARASSLLSSEQLSVFSTPRRRRQQ